jgi:ECF sigma factor
MSDVTRILTAIEQGEAQASEELLPLVYKELRRMAAHKMSNDSHWWQRISAKPVL